MKPKSLVLEFLKSDENYEIDKNLNLATGKQQTSKQAYWRRDIIVKRQVSPMLIKRRHD